jgi:lysophospholipase L1-like esterase
MRLCWWTTRTSMSSTRRRGDWARSSGEPNSMNLSKLSKYYGLQRPYDFRVAVPLLLNTIGLLLVLTLCTWWVLNGRAAFGTERFYFFCYLFLVFLIGAGASRHTLLSLACFCWCALELSLALASNELERHGLASSVFPRNQFTSAPDPRFQYHPILGIATRPSIQGEWHIDERNAHLATQNSWAWNDAFFAENFFQHNAFGARRRELSDDDLRRDLILVYGGSTTYDYNVTQGSTWVEQVEAQLAGTFTVVNFGVITHSTPQHLIQTALYQQLLPKTPACAVYYVGWNDLWSSHAPDLDPAYANYLSLYVHTWVQKPEIWPAKYSALIRLTDRIVRARFETVPKAPGSLRSRPATAHDVRVEAFFAEHVRTITAINSSRGITTVFIGRMMSVELLNRYPDEWSLPYIRNRDTWPAQERLNSALAQTAASAGAKYIDAGIEHFNGSDFADPVHFSVAGSAKFARLVAQRIGAACRRPDAGRRTVRADMEKENSGRVVR